MVLFTWLQVFGKVLRAKRQHNDIIKKTLPHLECSFQLVEKPLFADCEKIFIKTSQSQHGHIAPEKLLYIQTRKRHVENTLIYAGYPQGRKVLP